MNNIVNALGYIDEDLIFAALQTIRNFKTTKTSAQSKAHLKGKSPQRIYGGAKAIVISTSALVVCAAFVTCAIIVFTGNHALDIYRLDKEERVLTSFSEIKEYYPDSAMADKLSNLSFNDMQVALYYDNGTSWQDSGNWYSLIFDGYGEVVNTGEAIESYTVYCLFSGTLEDWRVDSVYKGNTQYTEIGGVEVQLSYLDITECSYAIFENNGVIYDIRVQFGNSTGEDLLSVLDMLLN